MPEVPHGERVPDVSTLLQSHFDAHGEKQADVVARAQRRGHQLSRQQLSKLAAGLNRSPSPETVRALAAGLNTTERVVWLSIGATLGLDVGTSGMADRITAAADDIPAPVLDSVEMLLRALTREAARHPYDPEVAARETGDEAAGVVGFLKSEAPSQQRLRNPLGRKQQGNANDAG